MILQPIVTVLIIDMVNAMVDRDDRLFTEHVFKTDYLDTRIYSIAGGQQSFEILMFTSSFTRCYSTRSEHARHDWFRSARSFEVINSSPIYTGVTILTTSKAATDWEQAHRLGAMKFVSKRTTYCDLSTITKRLRLALIRQQQFLLVAVLRYLFQ